MSLLTEVKGWSPIIHSLARQKGIGLITAAVYGAVWRYCQMDNRVCNASLETIGGDLGIDKATTLRHIKKLCLKGYLKDLTPDLRNVPHTYADTGKIRLSSSIDVIKTVAECNATVAESQLNRVYKRDSNRVSHTPEKILAENKKIAIRLTEICGYKSPEFVTGKRLAELSESVATLLKWQVTTEQLDLFGRWWWGKNPPTPRQVVEEWGKFLNAQAAGEKPINGYKPHLTPEQVAAARQLNLESEQALAESRDRIDQIVAASCANGIVQAELKRLAKKTGSHL